MYKIRYFKPLYIYLIHVCPLRGGTAATGRQGERTAYPTTKSGNEAGFTYMYVSSVLTITQIMSPISKERNSRMRIFTWQIFRRIGRMLTWRQGIQAATDSAIVIECPINGPTFS